MKLHFETWLDTQKISTEAQASFDESFICFKVGAYRAALLFAYTGFMNIIRDRICSADLPGEYRKRSSDRENQWEKLQKALKDEVDSWEDTSFNCIKGNCCRKGEKAGDKEAIIFILSDDLREQVAYWRSRRNDCAHSKPNLIIAAHVESFYAFLESNLGKFAVSGSKLQMQGKILKCFDSNSTLNKDEKLRDTIRYELSNSLGDLEFIKETYSELSKLVVGEPHYEFLNSCFQYGTDDLQEACRKFLNQEEKRSDLANFLLEYPENTSNVLGAAGEDNMAFALWNKEIVSLIPQCGAEKHFNLLCSFLNASLIKSEEEVKTVLERMVNKLSSYQTCHYPLSLDEVRLDRLFKAGMGNILKERILKIQIPTPIPPSSHGKTSDALWKNVCWLNNAANLIMEYLHRCPIEHDVAVKIAKFQKLPSPAEPQKLKSALDEFFKDNQCKEKEFYKHLDEQLKGS